MWDPYSRFAGLTYPKADKLCTKGVSMSLKPKLFSSRYCFSRGGGKGGGGWHYCEIFKIIVLA